MIAEHEMRFLILHGWAGNEPTHWQTWLANRLRVQRLHVQYPRLPDFDEPELQAWLAALDAELGELRGQGRTTVICHSLGCILWMHHAARRTGTRVERVLLVAPPAADSGIDEIASFFPVPLLPDAMREAADDTLLVYADDDPYCQDGAASVYGAPLEIESILVRGGKHLNVAAGFGPWPEMEAWALGRPVLSRGH